MSGGPSFLKRLWIVLMPTTIQALSCGFLALLVLLLAQKQSLLAGLGGGLGLGVATLNATQTEFHDRFNVILASPIASQLTLVTFWALIGLGAYLVCWGIYSIFVEVRNEVTLTTAYTNRGHWRGPFETLALKAVSAVGLGLIISSLWFGLSFWIALSSQVVGLMSPTTVGLAVLATLGLALQLYLVIVFIQLTFTPWYREEAFTDN